MKKFIGLFLFLVLTTGLLTSCLKTKLYEGSTTTSGNTFNIVSSNGIPTNINFSVTQTQYVEGASFEIKASNAIPVELLAPTNSLTVQVTNPISLLLTQAQAIQATLTISNKFENTNFTGTITLKLDPAMADLLPSTITITSAPIQVVWSGTTNFVFQATPLASDKAGLGSLISWILMLVITGVAGRFFSYFYRPSPSKELIENWGHLLDGKTKVKDILNFLIFTDVLSGALAALLVPVFMRVAFRFTLPPLSESLGDIVTVLGFAFVAGMLGIEFIRAVISLVQWVSVKADREVREWKEQKEHKAKLEKDHKALEEILSTMKSSPPPSTTGSSSDSNSQP